MNNADTKLGLGITRIKDLLFLNKITNANREDIKTGINFNIPDYQRPYSWTVENVTRLIDDIDEAWKNEKRNYRVGTLILHKSKQDSTIYDIVDGQQRIVTFFLLIEAFIERFIEPENNQNYGSNYYYFFEEGELYGFKNNFAELKFYDNEINNSNLITNFNAIQRRIECYKTPNNVFFQYLIENCELVVVITDDLSEAFQFFDSQNSRGKKLYPHDLLKAYHLRELNDDIADVVKTVTIWEDLDQKKLSQLFQEYLYRLKEWMNGNTATKLDEKNLHLFKGISAKDNFPYSQFYKAAYCYTMNFNHSTLQMVLGGTHKLCPFQLSTPIIAGRPFFEFAKHYYDTLNDVQDNDKYDGYFIKDNDIVKTLDLPKNKYGTGNRIVRMMFDTSILLYIDRFCPEIPSRNDTMMLEQFVTLAFIWAYSLRAQYSSVGWVVAQNYIMGTPKKLEVRNAFNIFKLINDSESPNILISRLSQKLIPLDIKYEHNKDEGTVKENYLYYFKINNYLVNKGDNNEQ